MKITLLFAGKTGPDYLSEGIEIYRKRLERYIPFKIRIIGASVKKPGSSTGKSGKRKYEKILSSIDNSAFLVLLDEKGDRMNSGEFAKFIEKMMLQGYKEVVFVTGGPYGFPEGLYTAANRMVSLSDMTFSHQMVRLILVEQLYRAMTIIRGEPYHHD